MSIMQVSDDHLALAKKKKDGPSIGRGYMVDKKPDKTYESPLLTENRIMGISTGDLSHLIGLRNIIFI